MAKEEFLLKLREALTGEIPEYQIEEHIRYYREYLSDSADGKTEDERLAELGEPRLIAKTILAAAEIRTESINQGSRDAAYTQYEEEGQNTDGHGFRTHVFTWDGLAWYQKVMVIFIGAALLVVLAGIFILGINIFLRVVLPILLIVFVARLIIMILRR